MAKQHKKSKYFAKISLAIMAVGFLATIPFQDSLIGRLLQGGFEAGLVGGLADWFAVTALFRHPLGIPIPHTALLPKNRDRMIGALINMLENDWLTKESIQGKIKQIKIAEKVFSIAEKQIETDLIKKWIRRLLLQAIGLVNIEKMAVFLEKELKEYLSRLDVITLLQKLIQEALDRKLDSKALDYVLVETEKWISDEETKFKIGKMAKQLLDNTQADGFLKMAISTFSNMLNEEKLGNMLQPFFLERILLLQKEDNPYRHLILNRIRRELRNFEEKKELVNDINNWKETLLHNWSPAKQIGAILTQLQNKLISIIEQDEFVDQYVLSFVRKFINEIREVPEKMDSVETWIQNQIFLLIDANHAKIGQLVKENLDKLDNETLIDMLENNVGKDLQWIRVNGAICGFFIGVILTVIKFFV
ncbi:DUF445 domain-containing protein [Neobacillus terrae]|uniref:DUF445 domain-containing protein n=1 Tax=Neobacillus terrae TaxID=3034837 RepID=UPI00140B55A0|nr:DUF445 domain-containing protein [Neobacillus terrae]NHM32046.1 DUF445 domain-containing protein [Neobacillus terrae]